MRRPYKVLEEITKPYNARAFRAQSTTYMGEGSATYTVVSLAEIAENLTWTMDPTSETYIGVAHVPAITVEGDGEEISPDLYTVKYFSNAKLNPKKADEATVEYDEMIHAGTYYVKVFAGDTEIGEAKKFVINKNEIGRAHV